MYYNYYQPARKELSKFSLYLVTAIFALMVSIGMFMPTQAISPYSNGFETDTGDWTSGVDRVASGTNGVDSSEGDYHATVNGTDYSFWGGVEDTWPGDGYTTELDVYLDMADATGTDSQTFQWNSSISDTDGDFLEEAFFQVRTDPNTANQMNVRTAIVGPDGFETSPWVDFSSTGWYTLQHTFSKDDAGLLDIELQLVDESNTTVLTESYGDYEEYVVDGGEGNVGGNYYGWFSTQDFDNLPIDAQQLSVINPDTTPPEAVAGLTIYQDGENIGCEAAVNERLITVDWDDNTEDDLSHYVYQADDGEGSTDFTTTTSDSERTGSIRDADGTYQYRVAAVDENGNQGEFSDWCTITLDREAPVVDITSHEDGDVVQGTVDVRGSVEDDNPSHYYTVVRDADGDVVAGPGTVNEDDSFTDESLFMFDTTSVEDGEYTLWLAARDAAGNRDDSVSLDTVVVTVNNTPDSKDQCKKGGWETFMQPTFRNQGDCVSWMASDNQRTNNPDANRGRN